MKTEISKHNSKILKSDNTDAVVSKSCDCRDKTNCPLPQYGCLAEKSVVYQATVTREDNNNVETHTLGSLRLSSRSAEFHFGPLGLTPD